MNKEKFIKELKKPANIILIIAIMIAIFLYIKGKMDEKRNYETRRLIAPLQQHE